MAIITFLLKKEWWWIIAVPAMVLSQILIILYRKDAKFGTIANVIMLAAMIVEYRVWNL
jgi:hypothetical protein